MSISVTNGKNFQIKKKVAGVDLNLYPITRIGNVYDASGDSLSTILSGIRAVPAAPSTDADKKFLRGDGTWQEIVDGTTSTKGLVQLSDTVETDSTKAATPTAVKSVSDALNLFTGTTAPATYMAIADYNFGTYDSDKTNVATLDSSGKVPSSQLTMTDTTNTESSSTIASATAVKSVADALTLFTGITAPATYVAQSAVGANGGVAPLNASGLIADTYLPSYVDDVLEGYIDLPDYGTSNANVVECYYDETAGKIYSDSEKTEEITPTTGKVYIDKTLDDGAEPTPLNTEYRYTGSAFVEYGAFYTTSAKTTAIEAESGKIYVDLATNKSYRWSGTVYVEISKSIVIGTTAGTAYDGAAGNTLRGDVDTHLAATNNPHSVTAAQVGLGNVENKSGSTIVSENVTTSYIKTTLGAATSSADGYMTSTQAAKLDNCQQLETIYQDESATITDGYVFVILEDAPVEEPGAGE